MVWDYCRCTGPTTPAPPGYVSLRLFLSTYSGICHLTPFQIREVQLKSESNYTTLNGSFNAALYIVTEAGNMVTGSESRQSERSETCIVSVTQIIEFFRQVQKS